jgi:hypothetical protein
MDPSQAFACRITVEAVELHLLGIFLLEIY